MFALCQGSLGGGGGIAFVGENQIHQKMIHIRLDDFCDSNSLVFLQGVDGNELLDGAWME